MDNLSRRQWLRRAAGTAVGGFAAPYLIPAGVLAADDRPGANGRVTIGAIAVGGRATLLLNQLPAGAQIVALCDCNLPRAEKYKADKQGDWPIYQDYRRILERKDIDAVIVGTGEFQRVLPCIQACLAGKDIYAEKPLTLYIQEGRALVNAVRKHKRILQVGCQQRSMAMNRIACELVRTGGLGKILEVRAINYPGPKNSPAEFFPEQPTPAGLDWNMWLSQAAWRPFNPEWQSWMQWRDFGGNDMTNWGAHGVDQIQWGLGMDGTGPVELTPVTPGITGQVDARYANGVVIHFVLEMGHGPMGGAVFVCEKGKIEINRNKFTSNPKEIAVELLKKVDEAEEELKWSDQTAMWQAKWHLQNWLECIKSRELPNADVEIGHRSISVCHLANITRWIGQPLKWDPAKEQFIGNDDANKLVTRERRKGFELPEV